MHEEPISGELVRLGADLAIPSLGVLPRRELGSKVLDDVLHDDSGLRDYFLGAAGGLDGDHGRLAERVDVSQLLGREHVLAALEGLQLIGKVELLEEPDDALSAGLLEPGLVSGIVAASYIDFDGGE